MFKCLAIDELEEHVQHEQEEPTDDEIGDDLFPGGIVPQVPVLVDHLLEDGLVLRRSRVKFALNVIVHLSGSGQQGC